MMNEKETTRKDFLISELKGIVNFPVNFVKETLALPKTFLESAKEFNNLQIVILCGLLGAIGIILNFFTSIHFGPFLITYYWIPSRIVDFLFGPAVGAVFGGILDIIKFITNPNGTFNIAYTAMAMLTGFLFGSVLYKKPISFMRIVFVQAITKVFINAIIGTHTMALTRGQAFMELFPIRLAKNLIMIPLDSILLFVVLTAIMKVLPRLKK